MYLRQQVASRIRAFPVEVVEGSADGLASDREQHSLFLAEEVGIFIDVGLLVRRDDVAVEIFGESHASQGLLRIGPSPLNDVGLRIV